MNSHSLIPYRLLAVAVIVGTLGQGLFFRCILRDEDRRSARLIAQSLGRVLEHAHRLNDDLTLQEAIQGLAQCPGVVFACVLDKEDKVLAHTQPALLGKTFRPTPSMPGRPVLWTHPLREMSHPWGSFALGLSTRVSHLKMIQQAWVLALANGFWIGVISLIRAREKSFRAAIGKTTDSVNFQCQELTLEAARQHQRADQCEASWSGWMQSALEHIAYPIALLDLNQHLIACNSEARRRLGHAEANTWKDTSWMDFPALAGCGAALQRTLEQPGQKISAAAGDMQLEFLSDTAQGRPYTWISWR